MSPEQLLDAVERFRVAYNDVDIETIRTLVSEDLHWEHHNRFKGLGADGFLESVKKFADLLPGRYFAEPIRSAVNGQVVFTERQWHGVPTVSDPTWKWEAGKPVTLDSLSVFAFEGDKIVEWSDYA